MEVLVVAQRNDINEIYHHGSICVVDQYDNVNYSIGDINEKIYLRSSSKFIQILPLLYYDIDQKYQLSLEEIAIMVSSHTGRKEHIDVIEKIIEKTNINAQDFCIKPCYPQDFTNTKRLIENKTKESSIYHMCSGKHLALMLIEKEFNDNYLDYFKEDSFATSLSIDFICKVANLKKNEVKLGLDGCGVPVFAISLYESAILFRNLACPNFTDNKLNKAIYKLQEAVAKYPDLIRDKDMFCSYHNYDKNVIGKDGAHGFYAFGLKKEKLGISFKLFSGDTSIYKYVTKGIYDHIGYNDKFLLPYLDYIFKNDNDISIGKYLITF